ncbi:hypothetical protein ACFX2J_035151 [Malus domestica]
MTSLKQLPMKCLQNQIMLIRGSLIKMCQTMRLLIRGSLVKKSRFKENPIRGSLQPYKRMKIRSEDPSEVKDRLPSILHQSISC